MVPNSPSFRIGLCAIAMCLPLAANAQPAKKPFRETALATFDKVWQTIDESAYDVRSRGVDWDAARTRFRPQAEAAGDDAALRRVLGRMVAEVGESHFGVLPGSVMNIGAKETPGNPAGSNDTFRDTGLRALLVEGRLTVVSVTPGSAAAKAGIKPGWRVAALDGKALDKPLADIASIESPQARRRAVQLLERRMAARLGPDHEATPVRLSLLDDKGAARNIELVPQASAGTVIRDLPLLPPMLFSFDARRQPVANGQCVGVVRFNVWVMQAAQQFPQAVESVRTCRGMVLDLRGNPGGVVGTAMGIGGYLVREPTALGQMRAGGATARLPALPRQVTDAGEAYAAYDAPLAILMDAHSASTSEVFASGMQSAKRARLFGTHSAGMALPSVMLKLPNGDLLQYATADLLDPQGKRLEGDGITPDQFAPDTLASLSAGRDAAMDAAIGWILSSPSEQKRKESP